VVPVARKAGGREGRMVAVTRAAAQVTVEASRVVVARVGAEVAARVAARAAAVAATGMVEEVVVVPMVIVTAAAVRVRAAKV